MAATRDILADKMTTEIDNKIFELSELIDKNADCLNSKSDQFLSINNYYFNLCSHFICISLVAAMVMHLSCNLYEIIDDVYLGFVF